MSVVAWIKDFEVAAWYLEEEIHANFTSLFSFKVWAEIAQVAHISNIHKFSLVSTSLFDKIDPTF